MYIVESIAPHMERFGISRSRVERILGNAKLFSIVFAGSFVLCVGTLCLLPRKYESRMKVLVSNERQDLVITPGGDRNSAYPSELAETRVNSEIELLRSRDVLKQVAVREGLAHEPGTVIASGEPSPSNLDRSIRSLEHHLQIEPVKRSEVIVISYRAKTPEAAKAVLTDMADAYLGIHLKAHATPGSLKFFDEQARSYATRLADSEEQLRQFREGHVSPVQPDQKDVFTTRYMEAQAAMEETGAQEAEYKERAANALNQLTTLDARVTSQVRVVPQTALMAQLSALLAQLENRRTEMISKFRPDDRFVTELDAQIAGTKAALARAESQPTREQTTDLNQVRVEAEKNLIAAQQVYSGLKAKRARLEDVVRQYQQRMLALAGDEAQSDKLIRQVKEDEDNYLLYSKKREEARIADSLDQQRITNVSLVEAPTLSADPVFPQIPAGIIASFLLSGVLAFLTVHLWTRFRGDTENTQSIDYEAPAAAAA